MQTTPVKIEENNDAQNERTPPKFSSLREAKCHGKSNSSPVKETERNETKFETPQKSTHNFENQSAESKINKNKTPEKSIGNVNFKLEQIMCDGEDGMISTTEQARILIAASKTPSKSMNVTPIKQNTPNRNKSIEKSPVTPGKYKRAELITLASPKTKRIKQV